MLELRTPMEIATQNADLATVKERLAKGDTPQDLNHLGIPVLYDALKTNRLELLEALYGAGLDLSTPYNQNGYTPLIYACLFCEIVTIEWLLDKGLNVNEQTPMGISAMHVAAQRGELVVTAFLYQLGANIFSQTKHGESPLLVSLTSSNGLSVFKFLLQCYRENERDVGNDLMRCIAYIFEKQHTHAVEAVEVLLPFAEYIPNEQDIRRHMEKPGNYSSSGLRSLENTLNTRLSRALFALLKSERVSRASRKTIARAPSWRGMEGL
ncbi:MAG: ankyrin repeat domain-containing protein [Pseudomonadota bacterium]